MSENKDTAIHIPSLRGGIAVEGEGCGGKTAAAFLWLTGAAHVCYWGVIDTHGVEVTSILMDLRTYESYERYETNLDKKTPVGTGNPKPLSRLAPAEREVYEVLVDPVLLGHRRLEQESLPLEVTVGTVVKLRNAAGELVVGRG